MERFLIDAGVPETVSGILADLTGVPTESVRVDSYSDAASEMEKGDFSAVAVTYVPGCESTLKRMRVTLPRAKVFVFGVSDTRTAARLMSIGAAFCFSKNSSTEQFRKNIARVIIDRTTGVELATQKHQWLVGESQAVRTLKDNLRSIVQEAKNVLISGEPGTGRSRVARIIHECGHMKHSRFKEVNLGMFDQHYLGSQFWLTFANYFSEIDGNVEGIRQPIYGTIYLKGLEKQPADFIATLLGMIRSHQEKINIDDMAGLAPRVLIAWSGDTECLFREEGGSGRFLQLNVPALICRKEDIPILIHTMVSSCAAEHGKYITSISLAAFNLLMNYTWPGNIRELQSIIESAVLTCDNRTIDTEDVGLTIDMLLHAVQKNAAGAHLSLKESVQLFQKEMILAVLKISEFSLQKAAQFLGLNKSQLFNKMKMLGIPIDTW